jgi:hypothetical protein
MTFRNTFAYLKPISKNGLIILQNFCKNDKSFVKSGNYLHETRSVTFTKTQECNVGWQNQNFPPSVVDK